MPSYVPTTCDHAFTVGTFIPVILKYDIAHGVAKLYTPYEVLSTSYILQAINTGEADVAGVASASGMTAATANFVYGAMFVGSAAEKTDTEIAALLTAMGWDVTWADAATADATSGKYYPLAVPQWASLDIPAPAFAWGFQESAIGTWNDYIGNIYVTKLIGYAGNTQITAGASMPGTSRRGASFTDTVCAQVIGSADSRLPNASTTSCALLVNAKISSIGSNPFPTLANWISGIGPLQSVAAHISPTGIFGINTGGGSNHYEGAVAQLSYNGPILLVHDVTNSRQILYTFGEKITAGAFTASSSGKAIWIGASSAIVPSPGMTVTHAACWAGTTAEFSDAQARALFASLGYTVTAW